MTTDQLDRLTWALADRYTIEHGLGAGGIHWPVSSSPARTDCTPGNYSVGALSGRCITETLRSAPFLCRSVSRWCP